MSHQRVVCLLLCFGAVVKGVNAQVRNTSVKVGGEAFLNCHLMKSEDVVRVTWQKISPQINLAISDKYFNQTVNPVFRDKVEFKDAGLQNSTIIIKNVKQQDEGCYNCLFNIQHQRAIICKTYKTCLEIYELNEPVLHVSKSSSTAEFIVSCSATGQPAPTVTLSVQGQNFSHTSTVRVPNTNGTVTVNTTAVLSGLHRTSTRVRCSVRLAFGSETEVFTTIPGFDEERSPSDSDDSLTRIRVPVVLVCAGAVAVVITSLFKKHMKCLSHSDHEENEDEEVGMELKDTHKTPSTRTPLKEENEVTSTDSLRQRGSAEEHQPRANPEQKTPAVKD
ncbi:OX-2 membrane glycoprotein-like isoform X1 [Sphaeramia orbicularis]|uniref:OX-2 membrane glycoprotein-like isoform X1 n=1 Tax=Sphaeramia orbicularis TaxID=375764 RepID=UPI00117DFA14|nr:OX-2 membrane glycoprotein-like isoform X1 [Sphaeramia orbicularis]XP_030013295.1 OX-2 membrane glycoprotein-like isoform X1 [Sphaeramia orbicularis]